jgi:sigma-E factor negative regulatory protein RseC
MLDRGRVLKVERNIAWIEFASSSSCAGCGACHKEASGKMLLEAENPVGAKAGDLVEVEISSAAKVLGPLLVFGTPLLLFILGLIAGSLISENAGIVLGLIFFLASFIFVKWIDRYASKQKKFRNRIISVEEKHES